MLSGDLTDFSLRDVLRLLATTGKSGLLSLHGAGRDGGVFVRDGGICLALVDMTRVPLGPRLVQTGSADSQTVAAAARAADGTALGLACALVGGAADAAAAATVVADHTREAIGWLSQFFAATFEFDPTIAVDAWPLAPLPIEQVLTDVEREAPQWAELREVVADLSLVAGCLPHRTDGTALTLTSSRWCVLALVDGRRSIGELLEAAGLGQLAAAREVAGLAGDGLVELLRPGAQSAVDALLANVHTVEAFDISPAWMARDDDVPARIVTPSPEETTVGTPPRDAVAGGRPETSHPARHGSAAPPQPIAPSATQPSGPEAGGVDDATDDVLATPDTAPDANLGLLNRLVGRGRSS